jgi:hypothetical protein
VLPYPGQQSRKQQEYSHPDAERDQRAHTAVHHDLVNDDLRKERNRQSHQLQHQGGGKHIAPDGSMLQELGDKPPQPKTRRTKLKVIGIGELCRPLQERERVSCISLVQFAERDRLGRVAAMPEQDD